MSDQKYVIVRDSYNRLRADISDDLAVGIRLLAEDHPRRVEQGVHAYVVADVRTELGPWRIRDIKIMWSEQNRRYFVRYRQWRTGKVRDGRDEWLDVAGPLDRDTRLLIQEAILGVFFQIKEEAAKGTLGRPASERGQSLGDNPEVAAQLEAVRGRLEKETLPEAQPDEAGAEKTEAAVEA